MNIGIDGYEANTDKRVGIGQYAFQLLTHIEKLDSKNSYTIFLPSPALSDLPKERTGWKYIVGTPGSFWTIRQLPFLIKKQKLDLFWSPTHYLPWFTTLPMIVSIMDLSYLQYPLLFKTKDLLQLKYMGGYSIRRATKVLTISEFSKKEIIKEYQYPEKNIVVTYPGISNKSTLRLRSGNVFEKYKIGEQFILFVGTIQPRKNVERLIEAFEKIKDSRLQLVLVGKKGWLYEPIFARINVSTKKDLIKWLDFVSDEDLPMLYENAQCFVLPSLYEGFGIPVVEAMTQGCIVVVANASSLPEVAGEAGIYVDPLKPSDIAKGIEKALQLKPEERRKLIAKGYEQAKKFNWENCAKKTLQVFSEIEKII